MSEDKNFEDLDISDNKKEVLRQLEDAHGIITTAANNSGIARSTFYKWQEDDPVFKKAVEDVQEAAIDYVESKLFEKIKGVSIGKHNAEGELVVYDVPPSDTAIIFYLKTKAKKRGYIERQEFTGGNGAPLLPALTVQPMQTSTSEILEKEPGDDA